MSALALILSIICSVCSYFATRACSFVQIEGRLNNNEPSSQVNPENNELRYGIGLFRLRDFNLSGGKYGVGIFSSYEDRLTSEWTCSSYSSKMIGNAYFDGAFKASRAFAIMANVCIGIGMLCLLASCCVEFKPKATKFLGCLFGAGGLFQLLTLTFLASSVCDVYRSCTLSTGVYSAIISTILALLTALLTCKIPAKDEYTTLAPTVAVAVALPEPGTKTVMATVIPDSTKNITETIVNADGSWTVTEAVARPEKA
jgi:hypothetical protein